MLPGGQFSKKAAGRSGRRLMRGEGVRGWKSSRGPPWIRGSRGVGGMSETIEAAPEAGRSFSGVCACGYFYSPPERHHRLGVLRSFLGWVLSPARRTPPIHPLIPPHGCRGGVGGCLDSSDSKGLYVLAVALAATLRPVFNGLVKIFRGYIYDCTSKIAIRLIELFGPNYSVKYNPFVELSWLYLSYSGDVLYVQTMRGS